MSTAIAVRNARGVVLKNVRIRGFNRGVVVENADLLMNSVQISQCYIGLEAKSSHIVAIGSIFKENIVDLMVENCSVELINTIANHILAFLSNIHVTHYAVNQYELQVLAQNVLMERNFAEKKRWFKRLLKRLYGYAQYALALYDLLKLILSLLNARSS